ncbi:aminotransferase family protein [Cordyceps javanica]|uniref:Aminotransferase family protein n=1 Tax=Cordyceps javanica TaxID=43265 RepID=A0A545W9S7_9HYPO|nr:aminotransferase family protein [Cordyceps javanica]TQW10743.1 aminotransferase [Cordyceps javanica]
MAASNPECVAAFGAEMRKKHFAFAEGYQPLNHGSFGTFPKSVLEYQRQLQSQSEARPDTWIRYTYLDLLRASRSALAPLLGVQAGEVVLVPNATTGVNTVLRNLIFEEGDVVLTFSTIYGACNKTIESLSESCPVSSHQIEITYPVTDDEIVARFRAAIQNIKASGRVPKLAMFDAVLTFPGARFPWETLVTVCREHGVQSFMDAAHGIGHIDLEHLGSVGPDFMVSNCYKWLMVPRGCAVLYVPFRNQHLISSTVPTSWGYLPKTKRAAMSTQDYFDKLFDKVSTIDNTPYCCIPAALEFRSNVCGGEAKIREYCFDLAQRGAARMAEIFGTQPLENDSRCCFATVRLPLTLTELGPKVDGLAVAKWMKELTPAEYETYIPFKFYADAFWCRISAQIYLDITDFEWAAAIVLKICDRAKAREWNSR